MSLRLSLAYDLYLYEDSNELVNVFKIIMI